MHAPFGRHGAPPAPRATHEGDLHARAMEQAALLRAGRLDEIDAAHVAEELDDVVVQAHD